MRRTPPLDDGGDELGERKRRRSDRGVTVVQDSMSGFLMNIEDEGDHWAYHKVNQSKAVEIFYLHRRSS